jgi:trehalose 6-phosphate phosphatase
MAEERSQAQPADNGREGSSIDVERLDAVLMDLDGVITETATTHARAWQQMFDEYLRARAERHHGSYRPFDVKQDYELYVDGKPRYDGVASFLESRDIYLPPGEDADSPDKETIRGLGNRKNELFLEAIRQHGVDVYQTSLDFISRARAHNLKIAVVTSSRNCHEVLEAAGIGGLFDAQVDGLAAREWMLEGKPAPDTYLEAARRLDVAPERAAVIEDAASGVQAGKAGHFGLVVGVGRSGQSELLVHSGADVVVSDLSELLLGDDDPETGGAPPSALERLAEVRPRIENRRIAVFLDYDGTLTPIVERPDLAVLSEDMRATLKVLAEQCTVVIVSGRERHDVERLVGLDTIIYAGSHGFDISGPEGTEIQHEEGASYVPTIAQAADELEHQLAPVEGVIIENKVYALAVHYRLVRADEVGHVEHVVDGVLERHPSLRKTGGKKVFELRPGVDWHKGKAVLWLLDALGLDGPDVTPIYLGDDLTDEDAFAALKGRGIGILVSDAPAPTAADYRLRDPGEVHIFLGKLGTVLAGAAR